MATITVSQRFQKITIPANTQQHDIVFANGISGTAVIEWLTGTAFQISNTTIDSDSGTVNEANPKAMLDFNSYVGLKVKGGAGSETFNIMVLQ